MRKTYVQLSMFTFMVAFLGFQANAQTPPNIIVINADDLSSLEFRADVMPATFKHIVNRGLTLRNFTVNTPVCGPSRGNMHTGLYAHNHGLKICNETLPATKLWSDYVAAGMLALEGGPRFQAAGYYTAMVGKYNSYYGTPGQMAQAGFANRAYMPPGWDHWLATINTQYFNSEASHNGSLTTIPWYISDALRTHAKIAIDAAKAAGQPLFLNLWPPNPHSTSALPEKIYPARVANDFATETVPIDPDYDAPATGKHANLQNIPALSAGAKTYIDSVYRDRLRSVKAMDQMVAGVAQHLIDQGMYSNTVLVITSDNGFHLGHFRLMAKLSPYTRSVKVPFAIAGPGIPVANMSELVTTIDVLPTLMDIAGMAADPTIDGQSFKGFFSGSQCWRRWGYVQNWAQGAIPFVVDRPMPWRYRALVSQGQKFVQWADGTLENYGDPLNLTNNIATLSTGTINHRISLLDQREGCSGVSCHSWDQNCP